MGNPKMNRNPLDKLRLSKVFVLWGYPSPLTCNFFLVIATARASRSDSLATARASCSDSLVYCYTYN